MAITITLALIALILTLKLIISNNESINKLRQDSRELRFENEELKIQLDNAEKRIVFYARKIRKLENIIIEKEQNNGLNTDAMKEIKRELFTDANQNK
jgi:hypothetical protein